MPKPRWSGSRRWTQEQARAALDEIEGCGMSIKRFAEEHGLGAERLYRWKRQLDRKAAAPSSAPAFAEVAIRPIASAAAIEIELTDGIRLRVVGEGRVEDAVAILSRFSER